MSVTGILLGMKKQTGLLAPTQTGVSDKMSSWMSMGELSRKAQQYLIDSVSSKLSTELDRIDIRPADGIAKFQFKGHYWGVQLDGTTGELLLVEKRMSDFIEALHDGSIIDGWLGTGNDEIKLGYTLITGISLVLLVLSGLWLWYGPKRLRKIKRSMH